jgi:hypothetical protein
LLWFFSTQTCRASIGTTFCVPEVPTYYCGEQ